MRTKVEIGSKTYRVYTLDVGSGQKDYVDVRVNTPGAVIVSHVWRPVPRDGPTWKTVMAAVEETQNCAEEFLTNISIAISQETVKPH